jgi:hypothetical protein
MPPALRQCVTQTRGKEDRPTAQDAIQGKNPTPTQALIMSTKVQKKEPAQHGHINLSEPSDVSYWADHFIVSEVEIIEAVKQVGPAVDEVKKFLHK